MIKNNQVIITSSNNYSIPTQLLAELLLREGVEIKGFICVNLFSLKRIKNTIRDRSQIKPLFKRIISLLFQNKEIKNKSSIIARFLKEKNIKLENNLSNWSKRNKVPILFVDDLNCSCSYNFLSKLNFDFVIYSGGGILREKFLTLSNRVINSHAGPLPEVRGMNAAEWTYLLKKKSAITIHFIDKGIDTGPIIEIFDLDNSNIYNVNQLRSNAILKGIQSLVSVISKNRISKLCLKNNAKQIYERQYFKMAPVLLEKLKLKLKNEQKGN